MMSMIHIITPQYVFWYLNRPVMESSLNEAYQRQLVLNEQYMVAAHDPSANLRGAGPTTTNRIIKTLAVHGRAYKTFGESIILLLNRESEPLLPISVHFPP